MTKFNPNSPQCLSLLFFGGMIQEEQTVSDGFYKNGNPRICKVKTLRPVCGLGLKPKSEWETKKDGIYSVDEEVLIWIRDKL